MCIRDSSSAADGEVDYVKIFGISEETEGDIGTYISKIEDSDTTTKSELFKFKYTGNWKSCLLYTSRCV